MHRLLITPDGQINHKRWLQMMLDGAIALAPLNAVFHSIDTVRMHGRTEVAHLTAVGFNPMHDYLRIARNDGYFNLIRQRDIENMRVDQKRSKICFPAILDLLGPKGSNLYCNLSISCSFTEDFFYH